MRAGKQLFTARSLSPDNRKPESAAGATLSGKRNEPKAA
jgi:hypothetical protein